MIANEAVLVARASGDDGVVDVDVADGLGDGKKPCVDDEQHRAGGVGDRSRKPAFSLPVRPAG